MKIGFIGLGQMGAGIARNLLRAGHEVVGYNRTRSKTEALTADGIRVAGSVVEACRDAEVCWTMLADDSALQDTAFAPGGILESLPSGATHLSSSTVSVAIIRSLSEAHASRSQPFLSVPVFGRPDAAEAGKLIAVAGGETGLIETLRPLITDISRAIFVAGAEPWQANLFKLCGNFTLTSMVEAMGEAFATIQKAGADHRVFYDVITELYGSPVYQTYGGMIVDRKFEPAGFFLRLALKDIRLALAAAETLKPPCPLPASCAIKCCRASRMDKKTWIGQVLPW